MEKATSKKTLIIIPAYNEQGSIGAVVENIRSHVIDADILVVNDGSQDRTARTARESGAMVISLPYNMGIGTAVQSGFLFAKEKGYHFVVQVDGDGQHPAKEIPRLLEALDNGADVAIGSRFIQPTGYRPPLFRAVGIRVFSFLVSLIVGEKVHDTTSGFRAANRKAILLLVETYPHDYPEVVLWCWRHEHDHQRRTDSILPAFQADGILPVPPGPTGACRWKPSENHEPASADATRYPGHATDLS